eukprot:4856055-Amphidinium_carterae.2
MLVERVKQVQQPFPRPFGCYCSKDAREVGSGYPAHAKYSLRPDYHPKAGQSCKKVTKSVTERQDVAPVQVTYFCFLHPATNVQSTGAPSHWHVWRS